MTLTLADGRRSIVTLLALLLALTMVAVTAPPADAAPDPIEDVQWSFDGCEVTAQITLSQKGKAVSSLILATYNGATQTSGTQVQEPGRGVIVIVKATSNTSADGLDVFLRVKRYERNPGGSQVIVSERHNTFDC